MSPDLDLFGVFVPSLLVWITLAYFLNRITRFGLYKSGAYRFVWHPRLFDFAIYLILLGLVLRLFR
jgi:hypothetical protein